MSTALLDREPTQLDRGRELHPAQDSVCTATAPGGNPVWTATGRERPVFFDEHGKRRRWVWLGGAFAGAASAFWLGALIAGAIGFSTMPSLQARSPLLASRSSAHRLAHAASPVPDSARHAPAASGHRSMRAGAPSGSPVGGSTELAVSRVLIAAR